MKINKHNNNHNKNKNNGIECLKWIIMRVFSNIILEIIFKYI